MDIHQEICNLLQYHTSLPLEEIQVLLATPPDPKMGDYAFPCFKLTSAQNKNPKDVATKLQTQLTKNIPNYLNRIEINGPYLNFYLNYSVVAKTTLTKIQTQNKKYGNNAVV